MLLELLELAGNNALQHDSGSRERLRKLSGNSMVLTIQPIQQSIAVMCAPGSIEFSASPPVKVDVRINTTVNALIKLSRHGMENADLQPGELEISGDPVIGQRFAQLLSELDIDWEAFLAEHLGDVPAHLLSHAASTAKGVASESKQLVQTRMNKLLTEDLQLVASKAEVEEFLDQVDDLRADADRLAARVSRLQN
ncbi:MAG: SCP2 sterol-binding domain-containing protein [Arenicella sp.]|nr:SCP2 sterol-binding domain-containing protein [Arenicella sp.]